MIPWKEENVLTAWAAVSFPRRTLVHAVMCLFNSLPFSCSLLKHYATNRKVAGSNRDEVIEFFNWPNPSSRNMALGSTQPLTEMSTWNIPGGKGRPAREDDNLAAIYEPIV
jgi:hypothetical protein